MFNTEDRIGLHLVKALQAVPVRDTSHGQDAGNDPGYVFYRKAAICWLCGQPVEQEQEAPFRIPAGDVACHKQCLMQLQSGVWQLLEHEGSGEPAHFEDQGHDDLLPDADTSQIRPYAVAPLDNIMPAANLDTNVDSFGPESQKIHRFDADRTARKASIEVRK